MIKLSVKFTCKLALTAEMNTQGGPKNQTALTLNNCGKNDTLQCAIHKIVEFFAENKAAIKSNNLIVAHCLNIVCKHGDVKWDNCCQHTVHLAVAYLHSHMPSLSTWKTGQRVVSTSIQLTFQCGVLCNRSIIRISETLIV